MHALFIVRCMRYRMCASNGGFLPLFRHHNFELEFLYEFFFFSKFSLHKYVGTDNIAHTVCLGVF